MRKIIWLLLGILILAGCAKKPVITPTTEPEKVTTAMPEPTVIPVETDPVKALLNSMSTEEKVGQLFLARCPEEQAGELAREYHLGGYILFGRDFENQTPDSIRDTIASWQEAMSIPMLIAVDEEGGTVVRISSRPAFRAEAFPSPRKLYDMGGLELTGSLESEKAYLLHSLGINVNMGPVCDVTTRKDAFMYSRSLGQSPEITAEFVADSVHRMDEYRVGSVLKHFPGYGDNADTHTGSVTDSRKLEQLQKSDLIPFEAGIRSGCGSVLMSHNIVNALDPAYPASLSPAVHGYLRYTMGFEGVIVTDDLAMGAVAELYGVEEAAILAVQAGNDLLCTTDFIPQFNAVCKAVENGRIPVETLDQAVRHVLRWKEQLGLL